MSQAEKKQLLNKIYQREFSNEQKVKASQQIFTTFRDIYKRYTHEISYFNLKKRWLKYLSEANNYKVNIYIHIPLCKAKCRYCQYFSFPVKHQKDKTGYLVYLKCFFDFYREIFQQVSFDCIYVGGGCPTIFSDKQFAFFTDLLKKSINLKDDYFERTFECNLQELTASKLKNIEDAGFNKISFGVQTFNKQTLKKERRPYLSPEKIKNFIEYCKSNFDFLINADLILGLGLDSEKDILTNVELLLKTNIDLITLYTLQAKIASSAMYKKAGSTEKFYQKLVSVYEKIKPLARKYGYRLSYNKERMQIGGNLVNLKTGEQTFRGQYSNYPTDSLDSIFAVGWGARGMVEGNLDYLIKRERHYNLYKPMILCREISLRETKVQFLAASLTKGVINIKIYKQVFKADLNLDFKNEINYLLDNKIINYKDGNYYWLTKDVRKRILYFGVFYPMSYLELVAANN